MKPHFSPLGRGQRHSVPRPPHQHPPPHEGQRGLSDTTPTCGGYCPNDNNPPSPRLTATALTKAVHLWNFLCCCLPQLYMTLGGGAAIIATPGCGNSVQAETESPASLTSHPSPLSHSPVLSKAGLGHHFLHHSWYCVDIPSFLGNPTSSACLASSPLPLTKASGVYQTQRTGGGGIHRKVDELSLQVKPQTTSPDLF